MSWNDESATGDTYSTLKSRIVHLQFRPGEVLMVQRLASELGVSRTPVREALVRLTEEDLVQPTDGRKFQVAPLSMQSVDELFEVREALEPLSAMGAAEHRKADGIERLKEIIRAMEDDLKEGRLDSFFENDWSFHDTIGEIHGNRTLIALLYRRRGRIQRIRQLTQNLNHRMDDTIGEHEAILKAVEAGRPDQAGKALLDHLEKTHAQLRSYLESGVVIGFPMATDQT